MTKDEAIAIILTLWVKDEWQNSLFPDADVADKCATALSVVSGTLWGWDKVNNPAFDPGYNVYPIQQVDWKQL